MSDDDIRARYRMLDEWAQQVPDSTPDAAVPPSREPSAPSVPRYRDDLAGRRHRRFTPLLTGAAAAVVVLGVALLVTRGPQDGTGLATTPTPSGPVAASGSPTSDAPPTPGATGTPAVTSAAPDPATTGPRTGTPTRTAGSGAPAPVASDSAGPTGLPVDRVGATAAFTRGSATDLLDDGAAKTPGAPPGGRVEKVTWAKGRLTVDLRIDGAADLATARRTCLRLAMQTATLERVPAAASVAPEGSGTRVVLTFLHLQPGTPTIQFGCDPLWSRTPLGTIGPPRSGALWPAVGGSSAYANDHSVQHADVRSATRSGDLLTVTLLVSGRTDVAPPDGTCLRVSRPDGTTATLAPASSTAARSSAGGAGGWDATFRYDLRAAAQTAGGPVAGELTVVHGCRGDYTPGAVGTLG